MPVDRSVVAVFLCFLLSGFAALLYQTVWTREFAFVFGTSDLAVATVLAAYMAGLALGAAAAARSVGRLRRPVLVYAVLELGIALCALGVPLAIRAVQGVAVALFGGRAELPAADEPALGAFYLASSFAILIAPTALMGATLPFLARSVVHREDEIGSRIGALYAVNTAGAVLGAVVAAFVLLPALGLRSTVHVGVATNAVVFALAAWVGRAEEMAVARDATGARADTSVGDVRDAHEHGAGRPALVLPILLASGVASFTYEVLWTRLLSQVLGGSVYSFATMLASFLVGITLGSLVASRIATTRARAAAGLAIAQLATAALSFVAFLGVDLLPALARLLGASGAARPGTNAIVAGLVLVPSTLAIGATFPFAVRVLARDERDAGAASARVYAWNTVGAIAGALGAGFVVVPALGFAGTLRAVVALNLVLAGICALLRPPAARRTAVLACAGLLVVAVVRPSDPWQLLRSSPLDPRPADGETEYFAVGRSATVMLLRGSAHWMLRTNGLPEAAILPPAQRSLFASAEALTLLPVLARPDAKRMLVVGFGGGSALESVPKSVERVDVIELEPRVIDANRTLSGRRGIDPLVDPRVHVHLGDARGSLMLSDARWDVAVSQPSHPWTAGASHLYTREFFQGVKDHLAPGGVFLQWIGLAFVDEALLQALVATMQSVFPHVTVLQPAPGPQALFLGSDEPIDLAGTAGRAIASDPRHYAFYGFATREDAVAAVALDGEASRRFATRGEVVTDDRNLLQMRSPRILARPLGGDGAARLMAELDPLPQLAASTDGVRLVRRLLASGARARAARVAAALPAGELRATASALASIDEIEQRDAPIAADPERLAARRAAIARELDAVIAHTPGSQEARFARVRVERERVLAGDPALEAHVAALDAGGRAVVEGWRRSRTGDLAGVQALDAMLAAVELGAPAAADALRLRIAWRIERGEAGQRREAAELAELLVPIAGARLEDVLLHARASLAAGEVLAASAGLAQITLRMTARPGDRALARDALALLERLPAPAAGFVDQRAGMRQRLERAVAGRPPHRADPLAPGAATGPDAAASDAPAAGALQLEGAP